MRVLCRTLGVSASGFYAWVSRRARPGPDRDLAVRHAIRVAHRESRGQYGSPRILHVLHAGGHRVGRNRVMRLMRADGLQARRRRRVVVTTDRAHRWTAAPNRLRRRFTVARPNRCWAADLTYLDTAEGWLDLAVVLDLYSRRVVGWAVRPTLQTELTLAALEMALQYANAAYQRRLAHHGCRPSMSRVRDCWDNAVVESFCSTLKHELSTRRWPTRGAAAADVADYIERFYNPVGVHATLGYHAPARFEAARAS